MKFTVKSFFTLAFILVCFVGTIYYAKTNLAIAAIIFGIFILFGGINILIGPLPDWFGISFTLGGIIIIIVTTLYLKDPDFLFSIFTPVVVAHLGLGFFFIVGLVMTLRSLHFIKKKKNTCTILKYAQIIELIRQRRYQSNSYLSPVLEYSYNKTTHRTLLDISIAPTSHPIGSYIDVYLNPNNPKELYKPKSNTFDVTLIMGIYYILFSVLCLLVYYYSLFYQ